MSLRPRNSTREPPYPTVIMVPPAQPAEAQSWLKKFGTAVTIIGTMTAIGVVVVNVARWSKDMEALRDRPASAREVEVSTERTRADRATAGDATITGGAPVDSATSGGATDSSSRSTALELNTPIQSATVPSQFRAQGRVMGKLKNDEVVAAFVRHGSNFWGKGQVEISAGGQFDHLVHEGGVNGHFSLVLAVLPRSIADAVDRDIDASHATGSYIPWSLARLGGKTFRVLREVDLILKR